MIGWIIAIIVGGVAGWIASMIMGRNASMGFVMNVIVGVIGSLVGNLLAGPLGFAGSIQGFSIQGLIIAVIGAVVLLGIINLIQRGRIR